MLTNKKSAIAVSAILVFSFISMIPYNNAYAQSSATFQVFETGNSADDLCTAIAQTGGITWLGCVASGTPTTLRINAMSGNSTINTIALTSQSASQAKFFPFDSSTIIYVDISGASEIVRKYQLIGSTITNTASLTLTGCSADTSTPSFIGSTLVYHCADGTLKLVNMNNMILEATYSTLIQGDCTNPNGAMLLTTTKGMVWCDSTELYLFTVSGSTITFTDSLTGLDSSTNKIGLISSNTAWLVQRSGGNVQIADINTNTMTFTSTIQSLPSQSDAVSLVPVGKYMFIMDATDDSILVYDFQLTQPSIAVANLSIPSSLSIAQNNVITSTDGSSFQISSSTIDTGRYTIMTDIIIDGTPLGFTPPSSETGGIDCTLSQNANILICRIVGETGGNIGGLGGIIDTGIFNIFTNSGLIDGSDTNPQTNGVGYFITAISFMLMIGVFFVASKNNLDRIPNYIYMIVSIAILGGLTAIGWIDPTLLILGAIIISGLAVAKYRDVLSGSFGGGDFR